MPINPKYEESIRESIVSMYQAGISVASIVAEIEGVSAHDVRRVLKEYGVLQGPGRRATIADEMDESTIEAMLADYYAHMPIAAIIEKYKLGNYNRFYLILHELGQPARVSLVENVTGKQLRLDRAMEMYAAGEKLWRIVEETGLDHVRIQAERHKRGLPGRTHLRGDQVDDD